MEKDLALIMASYNKGPYIERCIKSISEQTYIDKTEVIIVDDCSTDNSVEILRYSANKYHVPITLYVNERNLGMTQNGYRMRPLFAGKKFVTMLDLDDYYIHPERFERAVKFLKSHPDYSMHGCNFYWETEDGNRRAQFPENIPNLSFDKFSQLPFFQTSSTTYRNFFPGKLHEYLDRRLKTQQHSFSDGDPFRNFCAVHYGKVYLDNFLGSVYSMHVNNGVWASLSEIEKIMSQIQFNRDMAKFSRDFFHDEESAYILLKESAKCYFQSIDLLRLMMNDFSANDFHLKPSMVEKLNLQSNDMLAVFKYLLDQTDFLKSIGAGRKLAARN